MAILLKRDAKVFCSLVESGWTIGNTVRLNVLDDFSFSQTTSSDSAFRSTIGPTGDRGALSFVQETLPADFSFTTYMSTFSGALSSALLWQALTNKSDVSATIDFTESNVASLPTIFVYFEYANKVYKLGNAVMDTAAIDMNLDGIPKVTWSGSAKTLVSSSAPTTFLDEFGQIPETLGKLTTVDIVRDSISYTLALTNFDITLANNIQWVSRARIGKHTLPTVYEPGIREVYGNMQFYLKTGVNTSGTLADNILTDNTTGAVDKYSTATISLGTDINLVMPKVLLENTNIAADEVVVLDVPFSANQTGYRAGDEISISLQSAGDGYATQAEAILNTTPVESNILSPVLSIDNGLWKAYQMTTAALPNWLGFVTLAQGVSVTGEVWERVAGTDSLVSQNINLTATTSLASSVPIDPSYTEIFILIRNTSGVVQNVQISIPD